MSDFIERIQIEKQELDERLDKLETFLVSEKFKDLSVIDQNLLKIQCKLMNDYSRVLNARLMRLQRG